MFYVILNPDIFQCACGGREKIASCLIHDTSLALPERLDSLQLVIAFRLRNIQVLFFFIFFFSKRVACSFLSHPDGQVLDHCYRFGGSL